MSSLDELRKSAITNISMGNLAQGLKLLRTNLDLVRAQSAEGSLDFAQAEFTLALCLFQRNKAQPSSDYEEIYTLSKDALDIRMRIKGRVDACVAISADFLGSICEQMERLDEAELAYRISLENAFVLVGQAHVNTATAQLNVARILVRKDVLDEAKELVSKSIVIRRNVFGNSAPETFAALELFALICQKRGETCDTGGVMESPTGSAPPGQNLMK